MFSGVQPTTTAAGTATGGLVAPNPGPSAPSMFSNNQNTAPTVPANPNATAPANAGQFRATPTVATGATGGGLFSQGATAGAGAVGNTAPKEEKKRDSESELLLNSYLSQVLTKWRENMKDQVEEFQKVAVDIRKNEAELVKNHQLIYNLNTTHQSVKDEYRTLEEHLDKLEKDQDIIESQLNGFSTELERLVKTHTQSDPQTSGGMLEKCKNLNERMTRVDTEVEHMVQSLNQSSHAPDRIDQQQVTRNVSLILNNYFQTLQHLELETLATRKRLEEICLSNQL